MKKITEFWRNHENLRVKVINDLKEEKEMPILPFAKEQLFPVDYNDGYFEKLDDVRGLYVEGEKFDNCDMSYLNLSLAKFSNCIFNNVNMFCSRLHSSSFENCNFTYCNMNGIYAENLNLRSCKLTHVDLTSSYLIEIIIQDCFIEEVNFTSSRLTFPNFQKTSITDSCFSSVRIIPTKSAIKALSENKTNSNIKTIQWFDGSGEIIKSPLNKKKFIFF